jgi:hypothetical protein
MTQLQEQAIAEVRRLLKLHFDSWILSYRITDEGLRTKVNQDWHGDIVDVTGLAAVANHRMLQISELKGGPHGSGNAV